MPGRGTSEPVPRNALAGQRPQGSGQTLGRLPGTIHGELDLLAGQAPGLILRPHQVRFLSGACGRPIPSQSWCVSECFDRAGEQQHRP